MQAEYNQISGSERSEVAAPFRSPFVSFSATLNSSVVVLWSPRSSAQERDRSADDQKERHSDQREIGAAYALPIGEPLRVRDGERAGHRVAPCPVVGAGQAEEPDKPRNPAPTRHNV